MIQGSGCPGSWTMATLVATRFPVSSSACRRNLGRLGPEPGRRNTPAAHARRAGAGGGQQGPRGRVVVVGQRAAGATPVQRRRGGGREQAGARRLALLSRGEDYRAAAA